MQASDSGLLLRPCVPVVVMAMVLLAFALEAAPKNAVTIARDTVLSTHLTVDRATILTILPGVTIRFEKYRTVKIEGTLIAKGEVNRPIVFKGSDSLAAGNFDWGGFLIQGKEASAYLTHCKISGATRNLIREADVQIDTCEFFKNHTALYALHANPRIRGSLIHENVYGLVADCAVPILMNNTITKNTIGISLQLKAHLTAGKNSIEGNEKDISSEATTGQTQPNMAVNRMWDVLRGLK